MLGHHDVIVILLLLAMVSEFLAAVGVPSPRVNFVALGLFLWFLSLLIAAF